MRHELLAIDDADLHLSILGKIAAQAGYNTTAASSVGAAELLLRARTFDCITLDLSLGEQSGIEVLKLLSRMKCRTPVLVISASDNAAIENTVQIGNQLNINLCPPVPKPVNLAVLRQALLQIAEGAGGDRRAAAAEL